VTANICWEKINPKSPECLQANTPSQFLKGLREAFGDQAAWTFSGEDLPVLHGMAAADPQFRELWELVSEQGRVRVWAEH